jgi:hypothetical protein
MGLGFPGPAPQLHLSEQQIQQRLQSLLTAHDHYQGSAKAIPDTNRDSFSGLRSC